MTEKQKCPHCSYESYGMLRLHLYLEHGIDTDGQEEED